MASRGMKKESDYGPQSGGMESMDVDGDGGAGAARRGLIGVNNLEYRLEPDLSVAVAVTDKNHFFQSQQYKNSQRAVCIVNSGADYVDPRRSFLSFTVELPPVEEMKFGMVKAHALEVKNTYPNEAERSDFLSYGAGGSGYSSNGGIDALGSGDVDPEIISFGSPVYDGQSDHTYLGQGPSNLYFRDKQQINNPTAYDQGMSFEDKTKRRYQGSALNLIERIIISSRSGDELSRVERANLLAYFEHPWTKDREWQETVGTGMGMNRTFKINDLDALPTYGENGTVDDNQRVAKKEPKLHDDNNDYHRQVQDQQSSRQMRVSIPMYCLSGLFNYDKLLPSMLMSGMRIEIQWASPETAFRRGSVWDQPTSLHQANRMLKPFLQTSLIDPFNLDAQQSKGASFSKYACTLNDVNQLLTEQDMDVNGQINLPSSSLTAVGSKHPLIDFRLKQRTDAGGNNDELKGTDLTRETLHFTDDGLKQRIELEKKIDSRNKIPSYVISDIHFQLKSVQLTDSAQRILNEHSAVNGLEIVYPDYQNTQIQQNASGSTFVEVRHAASRALSAFAVVRHQDSIDAQTVDSFASSYNRLKTWQWRLGSLYFPNQPMSTKTGDAIDANPETYTYALDAFGKLTGGGRCAVKYGDWLTPHEHAVSAGSFYSKNTPGPAQTICSADEFSGLQVIPVSLERSTLFNLSGIPINNSRVLSFHGTFDATGRSSMSKNGKYLPTYSEDSKPLVIDLFLKYVRLARVFLNNVEVEQ